MSNEVLEYIGLDLEKENEKLKCTKPEYNITKSYDNYMLYKVYKSIPIKDIQILISYTDRTTEIKERYNNAKPINKFIRENSSQFEELVKMAKIKEIEKIDEQQKEFAEHKPYFIRYEKNYLWQIYYSRADNKYFMLFPAREGETDVLFYLIKKKLEDSEEKIFVPICKEDYSDNLLKASEFTDIENYISYFTKKWPKIYEVEDKIFITGETKISEGFESKYRIEINNKEDADSEYTLLKALFILSTETNYEFAPCIDDKGRLRLEYENEILQIDNLSSFIKKQANVKKELTKKLETDIKKDKKTLDLLKKEIDELIETYRIQEKQIVTFLNCKNSFFKKLRFYFKKGTRLKTEENIKDKKASKNKAENEDASENSDKNKEENKIEKEEQYFNESTKAVYNLSDLVKICKGNKSVEEEYKNLKADIKAMQSKEKTFEKRVRNAQVYLDEIEKHKKSIFDFWKFAKKDENPALKEGEESEKQSKVETIFNIEEDLQDLSINADKLQKQKLSIDECNSVFACRYVLKSINSAILGKNEDDILSEELGNLKSKYSGNRRTEIFGDIEDYTKTKNLNNKKHRENKKNIYSILGVNDKTSVQEYKDTIENLVRLLKEAYRKITATTDFPIYYTKPKESENEYTIAEINPKDIKLDELKEKVVYKLQIHKGDNLLYFSNIIYYDNYNQTLPNGMDETTSVLIKAPEIKDKKETTINVVEEDGLYNIKINEIKVIE